MMILIRDKPYNPCEFEKWQYMGTNSLLYPNSVGYVIEVYNITQRSWGGWI